MLPGSRSLRLVGRAVGRKLLREAGAADGPKQVLEQGPLVSGGEGLRTLVAQE